MVEFVEETAMAVSTKISSISEASKAWRLLSGVICVYKPLGTSLTKISNDLKHKLVSDLNSLQPMKRHDIVKVRRIAGHEIENHEFQERNVVARIKDGRGIVEVIKVPNMADHPLVVGPGYLESDIKLAYLNRLGKDSSGVTVLGINKGCSTVHLIYKHKWLTTYTVSGQFGKGTDTFFHTGKVLEKSTFHKIRKNMIDRLLASSQASFQRIAFAASGVPLDSERAYELASQGLVRPEKASFPIIYSLKCLKYDPPDFDIEIHCINETEQFLRQYVHELGLKLNTTAVCTKIRCVQVGPFGLDFALLDKHWTVEHVISNLVQTSKILKGFNLYERQPLVSDV